MNDQTIIAGVKLNRITIHVLFWLAVYGLLTWIYALNLSWPIALRNECIYVPLHIAYFYFVAYWLIPQYLFKNRHWLFVFFIALLMFSTAIISRLIAIFFVDQYVLQHKYLSEWAKWSLLESYKRPFWDKITSLPDFINAMKTTNMIIWFAVGIKLFKQWYERKQVALQAELRALKGQIHPHFLFNTLNNLYALTLNSSPKAPAVVLGLSDMLRYMLYECNADKVSLKKEVVMLQHYIGLEKIRYEDRLDLNFNITGDLDDKLIAPLMLLPLVENAFKHGISGQAGDAWININLAIDRNTLKFKVSNSKPETDDQDADRHHGHIGIQNIKKRLELLYPLAHQFRTIDDDDVFISVLEIELDVNKQLAQPVTT